MNENVTNTKTTFLRTILNWKFASTILIGFLIFLAVYFFNEGFVLGLTFGITVILSIYLFTNFPKEKYQQSFFILIYILIIGGLFYWYYTTLNIVPVYEVKDKVIPPQIMDNFKKWGLQASLLRVVYVFLGLVSTTSSILAASTIFDKKETQGKVSVKSIFMIVAAISFSILTAFDLGDKANRERTAWRDMNVAIMKYQQGVDTSMKNLIEAYDNAEQIIGDVKPSPK